MVRLRVVFTVGLAILALTCLSAAPQDLTHADAEAMQRKVDAIEARGALAAAKGTILATLRTSFTERELNAYLKYGAAAAYVPAGVVDPHITLLADGHMAMRAVVDLDAVRKSQPRGALNPLAYLTGSLEVRVSGVLHATHGQATFDVDTATVAGVPIPKAFLQELVTAYSKSPIFPDGISLEKPFAMASGIQAIEIQLGSGIIIQ
jgi:hypothetical protein